MKTLKQFVSAVALSILASTASAQTTETTPNQITSGTNHTWTGVSTGSYAVACPPNGGACSGGPGALYDPNTNTIHFSYGQSTAAQTFAINQALSNAGTGIQVQGYNYTWDINNNNGGRTDQAGVDTLTARVLTYTSDGVVRRTDSWTYNTKFDWTTFSGTVNYFTPGAASEFGNLRVEFTGSDSGFWGGYFGPQVRNVNIGLNYTVDQCAVNPQSSPSCPGYKTYYQMWDDGYAQVNLPFAFPFQGFTFTTSYMFTNGVIGFLNPNNAPGGYCCDGVDLHQQRFIQSSPWNFAIYALNTDLYPGPNSTFYTQETNNGQGIKYSWDRVTEIGTDLENTFHVELRNTGYIGITYDQVNLSPWRNPLIGIAGDIYQGRYSQYYFGPASSLPNLAGNTITFTGNETTDTCSINPLINPSCPGYASAYLTQQCSINVLYDPACPGYAEAYFSQQCTANPLYDIACPGYATAYYNYQCSANPLYHTGCPGYQQAYFDQQCSADPLYNSGCTGYQQAYFDQQCGLNGLYSTQCPNYADAYYVQQCTISPLYDSGCTGYTEAYFSQQCTADPLYNNQCPGYATAYFNQQCSVSPLYNQSCPGYQQAFFDQQCSLDPLYNQSCPGYATAYFNQQCSISPLYNQSCPGYQTAFFNQQCTADPLYNNQCPGYSEAYAKKNILNVGSSTTPTETASTPVVDTVAIATATSDPVASAAPVVADPIVNQTVTTTATSASPAQAATATVPLVPNPESSATSPVAVAVKTEEKKEEKKEEVKTETASSESSSSTTTASSSSSDKKDQPKTTRQALAERRLEAARAKAIEDGKQLAGKMGEAASMEAQVQVQGVVVAAMSFVPGFDRYGQVTLPDVVGYKPFEIYKGQRNVDNPAGRRFLTGADARHQEMVDQQYAR